MQDDCFRLWELKPFDTCYKGHDDVDICSISSFCPAFLQGAIPWNFSCCYAKNGPPYFLLNMWSYVTSFVSDTGVIKEPDLGFIDLCYILFS